MLEDSSEVQISKSMYKLYKDLNDKGDEAYYHQLLENKTKISTNQLTLSSRQQQHSQTDSEGSDFEGDDDNDATINF